MFLAGTTSKRRPIVNPCWLVSCVNSWRSGRRCGMKKKPILLYENSIEPPSAEMACTCQINIWWYLVSASMLQHVLAITLLTERYFHIPTECACGCVVMWFFFQATLLILLSYFPKVYILGARFEFSGARRLDQLQAIATAVGDGTTLNDRHGGLGK